MSKKQRRKIKTLTTQQLNYLKKDRAYRYCKVTYKSIARSLSTSISDFSDNIYPDSPHWKEENWKRRYSDTPQVSLIFPAGINKITTGTITSITINGITETFKSEQILYETDNFSAGDFCLNRNRF